MGEPKFTPGPWRFDESNDHGSPLILSGDAPVVAFHQSDYDSEAWWEVEEANANLIAAAPDLYASLQTLVTLHAEECPPRNVGGAIEECPAVAHANSVLAKARGEATPRPTAAHHQQQE